MPRASVIVPTYNEAKTLPLLVPRVRAALPDAEIVVVDDGSGDGTADVARGLGARVVERKDERGLSTAVLRGLSEASCDVCVVMDADLSHPPEAIPALVKAVEDGAEVAVGSRYVPGGDIDRWTLLRRLTSKAGTALARPLTAVRDPLAGFFCLRKGALKGVELKPRGFKILLEILARTRARRTVEVPIVFADRAAGESKFGPRERREYARQLWSLYRDLNAWPLRLGKFLLTGASGYVVHIAILCAMVEWAGLAPMVGAVIAFSAAMTSNYAINRAWTFRARATPVAPSYALYAVGAVGGLGAQLAVMWALARFHYVIGASLGIVAGTAFTYLTSELVFRRR
jgi:dolichol-phosphate mannosyltransferase